MILTQPPVATFVQDDATRPQLVSAPRGNPARKKARPAGRKRTGLPPNSLRWDQPTQSPHQYSQLAQLHFSGSKNKPQGKTSFRLTL